MPVILCLEGSSRVSAKMSDKTPIIVLKHYMKPDVSVNISLR